MKTWLILVAAVVAPAWMQAAEVVQTKDGPVHCWRARPGEAGVVCVMSNGIHTIPWAAVTDPRFQAPDTDPLVGEEWYNRIGLLYALVNGKLMRRELVDGKTISVIRDKGILLVSANAKVVAVTGVPVAGMVDGAHVSEYCLRAGEYQYVTAAGAVSTVALYRHVPMIQWEDFRQYRESAFPDIALARQTEQRHAALAAEAARQQAEAVARARREREAEEARQYAARLAAAERARRARLDEQFKMK